MNQNMDFMNKLNTFLPEIKILFQEPMAKHTSFRIGGPARAMAFPQNPEELAAVRRTAEEMGLRTYILGAGTNVLAPDQGLSDLVICLKDCLGGMKKIDDTHIWAAAGVTMSRAAVFAAGNGLSGLEFAHGIPGSVGGGIYMNAGAYGGEMAQVCQWADVMDKWGSITRLSGEQMGFSYRHSCLEETGNIVLGACFSLEKGDETEIRSKMSELMIRRKKSQPLELPSAGSAFKRPAGAYAAALIEQAGLKGFQVGSAAISGKHAGFAVNLGGATAADVKTLLGSVSDQVYEKFGIRLEPEVRIW